MSSISTPSNVCTSDTCNAGGHLMKRNIPKINGSVTGFILLVVFLGIIIIVAGSAAIYLWRENASINARRPTKARYHKKQASGASLMAHGADTHESSSWFSKFRTGLRRLSSRSTVSDHNNETPLNGADTRRWIHARSGSDFSYTAADGIQQSFSDSEGRPETSPKNLNTYSPSTQPRSILSAPSGSSIASPRHSIVSSDSSLNVRFELQGIRGLSYPDRFSPSPQPTLPSIHRQLSSHSSSHSSPPFSPPSGLRTTSPEPVLSESPRHMHANGQLEGRLNTSQSGNSVATFDSGSKFIEGL